MNEEAKQVQDGQVLYHDMGGQDDFMGQNKGGAPDESESLIPIVQHHVVRRVAQGPGGVGHGLAKDGTINDNAVKRNEKQIVIGKLRSQNDKLKVELKMLTGKLETFIEKSRQRKHKQMFGVAGHDLSQKDEQILQKEAELKQAQAKTSYYKKEIENMRRQLEGSYNLQKIVALEDEQKNKERILRTLQDESESLLKVQREQEKALVKLQQHGDYDQKIGELGHELRTAKEQLRKLQFKQREDEKAMKVQHEQLVVLEDKCRKMRLLIKDKKRERLSKVHANSKKTYTHPDGTMYTKADLERLQQQLRQAEQDKTSEEKRLKQQMLAQENQVKNLQRELDGLTEQLKSKEYEHRSNDVRIKEQRRQLPAKVLKPLDQKFHKLNMQKNVPSAPVLPPQAPKLGNINKSRLTKRSRNMISQTKKQTQVLQPARSTPLLPGMSHDKQALDVRSQVTPLGDTESDKYSPDHNTNTGKDLDQHRSDATGALRAIQSEQVLQTLKSRAEEDQLKPVQQSTVGHFDDKVEPLVADISNINENSIVDEMPTKRSAELVKASEQVSMAEQVYDEDDFELEQDQSNI